MSEPVRSRTGRHQGARNTEADAARRARHQRHFVGKVHQEALLKKFTTGSVLPGLWRVVTEASAFGPNSVAPHEAQLTARRTRLRQAARDRCRPNARLHAVNSIVLPQCTCAVHRSSPSGSMADWYLRDFCKSSVIRLGLVAICTDGTEVCRLRKSDKTNTDQRPLADDIEVPLVDTSDHVFRPGPSHALHQCPPKASRPRFLSRTDAGSGLGGGIAPAGRIRGPDARSRPPGDKRTSS